jgi:hypothetical protein
VFLLGATERIAGRLLEAGRVCITDVLHLQLQFRQSPEFSGLKDLFTQRSDPGRNNSILKGRILRRRCMFKLKDFSMSDRKGFS